MIVLLVVIIITIATIGGAYFDSLNGEHGQITSQETKRSSTGVGPYSTSASSLILYSADAYVVEIAALATGFTTQTGVHTTPPKGGGSLALAREIAQGNPVSVFVSVSKSAVSPAYLNRTSSGWAIAFAGDQMCIAYSNVTKQNTASEEIINAFQTATSTNTTRAWISFYSNLTSGIVKVGISNPNADPAGYRGWLVLEAAGYDYGGGNQTYFTARMLQNRGNVTGASAADLIAPLQAGQIQFLFIYRSAAVVQGLNYLNLPSSVNLGDPNYAKYYTQFTYQTAGGQESGDPIVLFVTVPKDSTNELDSLQFATYVVQHTSTLSAYGLTPFSPSVLYNNTAVPQTLEKLISEGSLVLGGLL